jgi:hypothetical protein
MQVGKEQVGNILHMIANIGKGFLQGIGFHVSVVSPYLFRIMIPYPSFNEDFTLARIYQQATQGEANHVVVVGRVNLAPQGLGDDAEEGASVAGEITGMYGVKLHGLILGIKVGKRRK